MQQVLKEQMAMEEAMERERKTKESGAERDRGARANKCRTVKQGKETSVSKRDEESERC